VRFSGDGRRLATCGCDTTHTDRPHEIKVWNAVTGDCLASVIGNGLPFAADFSPDGRWLAVGAQDGIVLMIAWERSPAVLRLTRPQSHVAAVAFWSDGKLFASAGGDDKMLKIWEMDGADPVRNIAPQTVYTITAPPFLCDLAFSPDGRRLAGATRDV